MDQCLLTIEMCYHRPCFRSSPSDFAAGLAKVIDDPEVLGPAMTTDQNVVYAASSSSARRGRGPVVIDPIVNASWRIVWSDTLKWVTFSNPLQEVRLDFITIRMPCMSQLPLINFVSIQSSQPVIMYILGKFGETSGIYPV